jgi:hypothetical protein
MARQAKRRMMFPIASPQRPVECPTVPLNAISIVYKLGRLGPVVSDPPHSWGFSVI